MEDDMVLEGVVAALALLFVGYLSSWGRSPPPARPRGVWKELSVSDLLEEPSQF
jgi:hypothetical protein